MSLKFKFKFKLVVLLVTSSLRVMVRGFEGDTRFRPVIYEIFT